MKRPYEILVVCTANVCRSPMAEYFLQAAADDAEVEVVVASSGFLAGGEPASPMVVDVMKERGADISTHLSRSTTAGMVAAVDLVVTMERRHARDLVLLAPGASWKIHTLGAVVEGLEGAESDEAADVRLRQIASERPGNAHLGSGGDEVDDPFGRSRRVNRATAERLEDLSSRLVAALFGPT